MAGGVKKFWKTNVLKKESWSPFSLVHPIPGRDVHQSPDFPHLPNIIALFINETKVT